MPLPAWGAEVSAAGSYSADLRERLLAAVEAGATVRGRPLDHPPPGDGPKPKLTGELKATLLGLLEEANHRALAEYRDRLAGGLARGSTRCPKHARDAERSAQSTGDAQCP